jgi:Tfp pilus assembly protein PilO
MLRTPTRLWAAAGAAACLLLVVAGYFFVVSPQQAKATASWAELTSAQGQTASLRSRVNVLKTRFDGIDEARAGLDLKRQSLPASNELDTLVLALNQAGAATGVSIDAVVPAEPIDVTPIPPKPEVDPDAEPSEEPAEEAARPKEVVPVVSDWPLFVLPVTIRVSGPMANVQNFIKVVQTGQPRAVLFTSLTVSPSLQTEGGGGLVTMSAVVDVFVSPVAGVLPGVVAPVG